MANVFFISDLHLGHKNIQKYRKNVESEEHNYQMIHDGWHSVVTKRDIVYCLGDVAFTEERLEQFSKWIGRKILICGNHDRDKLPMSKLVEVFDGEVYSLLKYKEFWLSHAPIHISELRGRRNIHGHTHYYCVTNGGSEIDNRYINVSIEQLDKGTPISLEEIRRSVSNG